MGGRTSRLSCHRGFQTLLPLHDPLVEPEPDGEVVTLHLARSPDWQPGGESFAMDYWHQWDGSAKLTDEISIARFREGKKHMKSTRGKRTAVQVCLLWPKVHGPPGRRRY